MGRRIKGSGSVRQLPSGRWQATYLDHHRTRHSAPRTFDTKRDAQAWLDALRDGTLDPSEAPGALRPAMPTLADYWPTFLANRPLRPRTAVEYARMWKAGLEPAFGKWRLNEISQADVRAWWNRLPADKPTRRAHLYGLLRTVLNAAIDDEIIRTNPCRIRGAGQKKRARTVEVAEGDLLDSIVEAMPADLQAAVLLAAWCGLRRGELLALNRGGLDLAAGIVHVRQGVVRVPGETIVGKPKTDAGIRDVAIPPHLIPALQAHLDTYVGPGPGAPLFTAARGGRANADTLRRPFEAARDQVGRPDLRLHDLRHTGATMAARSGATIAELQARLGHSTPNMAMRYQHAAARRDQQIAEALSRMAGSGG